jgi:hypothetical protein
LAVVKDAATLGKLCGFDLLRVGVGTTAALPNPASLGSEMAVAAIASFALARRQRSMPVRATNGPLLGRREGLVPPHLTTADFIEIDRIVCLESLSGFPGGES